jgi:O-antigen/teichoic acid export membrane protein
MQKLEKLQFIKNVGSNWIALATDVLVGFFLSPFILHRLGDAAFGIWVLIFSITGYYGLFDLGIRSSLVRYVSKAKATGDMEYATRVINTSLFSYTCIGTFAFLITIALSASVDSLFHIDPQFHNTARWLLLMVGSAVSLGFPLGISGGVLEGLQRFDVASLTRIVQTLLKAVLIVFFLTRGFGLLTVAFITVTLPILSALVCSVIALRILPVRIGLSYVDRETFREIARYSGVMLIMIISGRLRFRTDAIVIGTFLSSVAITYFNIGARIVDYAGEVVEGLAQLFVPMSSHSEATGNVNRLRLILIAGNRFCAFIIFPLCALLVILGKSVIEVWVGKRYVAQSYPVLLLMLIPSTLMLSQLASGRLLVGSGKHRTWAVMTLVEGVANLVLSILLVRPYGIIGDALGTAIPLSATAIFFLPAHVCRKVQVSLGFFLRQAYTLPLVLCAPLIVTLLLMKRWFVPHTYLQLLAHVTIAAAVYGLALSWAFVSRRALRVGQLQTSPDEAALGAAAVETYQQDI